VRIEFDPAARVELLAILKHYAAERRSLAVDFLDDLERSLSVLALFPHSGAVVDAPVRRVSLSRFRYTIFYQVHENELQIVRLEHMHRKPRKDWPDSVDEASPAYLFCERGGSVSPNINRPGTIFL
jgi:plasmid stabilization system protein ParE